MPEVVLDSASIDGLLHMAADEGILRDKEDYGDRLLYGLQQSPLAEWHRQQILEQVILNSRIYTIKNVPFDWVEGDFLDTNLIQVVEGPPEWNEEGKAVAPEVIEGILRARGYNKNFDEWASIFDRSKAVFDEVTSFQERNPGVEVDSMSTFFRGLFDNKFRESEQYSLSRKWELAYQDVRPFTSAFEEYLKLSEYAAANARFLKTPLYRLAPNLINLSTEESSENAALKVYRIATRELGFVPICSSLRRALEITRNPDVESLRNQIDAWLQSLVHDSADITSEIQGEIQRASKSLAKAEAFHTADKVIGYICIPVGIASFLIPLLGALGFALTCVAILGEKRAEKIEARVRWVGFGSGAHKP